MIDPEKKAIFDAEVRRQVDWVMTIQATGITNLAEMAAEETSYAVERTHRGKITDVITATTVDPQTVEKVTGILETIIRTAVETGIDYGRTHDGPTFAGFLGRNTGASEAAPQNAQHDTGAMK